MNKIITQINVNESHLEFNNSFLNKQERKKLVLRNFLSVIEHQFMGNFKAFWNWYNSCRQEPLTEYSYTGMHQWKQRGIATIDFDFFIFIAEQLNLPSMAILGYKKQTEDNEPQSQAVKDEVYIDASKGDYNSLPINDFDSAGWYVMSIMEKEK